MSGHGSNRLYTPLLAVILAAAALTSTVPAAAAQDGACNRTTAAQVAGPLSGWYGSIDDPIKDVLCGEFAGPGSNVMIASLAAGTCWTPQGFAIFRFVNGAWQKDLFVGDWLSRPLTVVADGIREVSPVFNSFDPRCIPSGGTRGRTWRWDGTRFRASAWQPTRQAVQFSAGQASVACHLIDDGTPPGSYVYCWRGVHGKTRHARLGDDGTVDTKHREELPIGIGGPAPPVGEIDKAGRFRCRAERIGIRCWVLPSRKGMLFTERGVRPVTVKP